MAPPIFVPRQIVAYPGYPWAVAEESPDIQRARVRLERMLWQAGVRYVLEPRPIRDLPERDAGSVPVPTRCWMFARRPEEGQPPNRMVRLLFGSGTVHVRGPAPFSSDVTLREGADPEEVVARLLETVARVTIEEEAAEQSRFTAKATAERAQGEFDCIIRAHRVGEPGMLSTSFSFKATVLPEGDAVAALTIHRALSPSEAERVLDALMATGVFDRESATDGKCTVTLPSMGWLRAKPR